jgi:aminomethyltransferase
MNAAADAGKYTMTPTDPVPPLLTIDRSERGRIRAAGRDRQSFLQGMVTNDVARLKPGEGCYAFLLDATGHVLADARILVMDEALLLDVEPGRAGFVIQTLERYLIMERVRLVDVTDETHQLLVAGRDAAAFLAGQGVPDAETWGEGRNAAVPALGGTARAASTHLLSVPAFDVYFEDRTARDACAAALAASGAATVSADTIDALRIEAGCPLTGIDIDERVLAPETGQQQRAISYRKGCYIGQEIVARIDSRGHTNRTLAGFAFPSGAELPAPGTVVMDGERQIGRITSAALSPALGMPIALGYIRREFAVPGTAVTFGGLAATVHGLPFVSATTTAPLVTTP